MKKIFTFIFVAFSLLQSLHSYVLVRGTQMRDSTDFSIDYDIQFRQPYIDAYIDTLTQDTTIIGKLDSAMIRSCINDVNPRRILVDHGPRYLIGNEVSTETTCHIEYEPVWNKRLYGQCLIPSDEGNIDYIDVLLNSYINKENKWGTDAYPYYSYKNPRNVLTHELIHSVGFHHSLEKSDIMKEGGASSTQIVNIGEDEENGCKALYNPPEIIEPTITDSTSFTIPVIKGQNVHFKLIPTNLSNPAYTYLIDGYKAAYGETEATFIKTDSLVNDTVKFTWDTGNEDINDFDLYFFINSAERINENIFNSGQYTETQGEYIAYYACDQRPSTSERISVCDYLVYEPKADTAVVAKEWNYIPVSLRISDLNSAISNLDNVYNIDSLRVQYVLWNDGFTWLNDSISTSPSIDPRKEFKWYFAQFDSDTTINMNHPDLEVNADYFIKAHLYQKDGENLTYIGTAESGNFDIMPEVMMWIDPTVSENEVFKSTDTTHLITAVCLEPDGTNYGFWGMDYYYKFDDESVWSPIGEIKREKEEIQVDTCTWNCGTKKGYGWLKAVADLSFWNSGECADSMRFVILEADLTFRHFKYDSEGLINSKGGTSLYTTVHKIGADCCYYDNGTYSWVDRIGSASNIHFYYKYPLDEDFTHMNSTVTKLEYAYGYACYETKLDTGENKDSVTIKIETDVLINGDTVTLTKEKTFGLIDRYLSFVEPKPVGEGIVDFESNLKNINDIPSINFWTFGQFQAEEGFDIDKYKDNTQSTYTDL